MKKIIITIGILLIGMIGMAYLYFSNLQRSIIANDLPLNAVSANAGLVFSFDQDKSFYEILNGQDLFQHILGKSKADQLKSVRDQLLKDNEIIEILSGQKIYIGLLPGNADQVDFLICTQLKEKLNPKQLLSRNQMSSLKVTPDKELYKITFSDSVSVYLSLIDKLLIVSNNSEQLRKVKTARLSENLSFANYIKANYSNNKNTLANLYVNFNALPSLLKNILTTKINGELNVFNEKGTYAALNYNFSSEKLLFNGTTALGNIGSYYKLFDNLPDQKMVINNLLPKNTANYIIYSVQDYKKWLPDLSAWLTRQKGNEKILKLEEDISKKYALDLKQIFPNYFKNQFITFQLNSGEKFGGIALSNGEKVGQLLMDLSSEYSPDIRIFREAAIPYTYFGDPFKKFEKPYYTIIDNYLIIANNASSVQSFLNSYRNNELLINESSYQHLVDQLSSATISFYVNNKNSNGIFSRNLKAPYFKQYQSNSGLGKFDAFSYQLTGDKGNFLSNLLLITEKSPPADTAKRQD